MIPGKLLRVSNEGVFIDQGILPDSGGLADQDTFFVNAYTTIKTYEQQLKLEK